MIKILKKYSDKEYLVNVILTDVSNTFDTKNHSLLLAKVEANGFSITSLKLLSNKMDQRENYQDFLKMEGGIFRSFSYNN